MTATLSAEEMLAIAAIYEAEGDAESAKMLRERVARMAAEKQAVIEFMKRRVV